MKDEGREKHGESERFHGPMEPKGAASRNIKLVSIESLNHHG